MKITLLGIETAKRLAIFKIFRGFVLIFFFCSSDTVLEYDKAHIEITQYKESTNTILIIPFMTESEQGINVSKGTDLNLQSVQ